MEKPSKLDLLGDHLGSVWWVASAFPHELVSLPELIDREILILYTLVCFSANLLTCFLLSLFWVIILGGVGQIQVCIVLIFAIAVTWSFLSFNPKARHFNHLRYQVLGVSPQATPEEIRRAYRAQARGVPAELSYSIIYQEMRSLAISNGEMLQEVFFNYRTCSWSFLINNRRCYFVFSCVKSTFFASDFDCTARLCFATLTRARSPRFVSADWVVVDWCQRLRFLVLCWTLLCYMFLLCFIVFNLRDV